MLVCGNYITALHLSLLQDHLTCTVNSFLIMWCLSGSLETDSSSVRRILAVKSSVVKRVIKLPTQVSVLFFYWWFTSLQVKVKKIFALNSTHIKLKCSPFKMYWGLLFFERDLHKLKNSRGQTSNCITGYWIISPILWICFYSPTVLMFILLFTLNVSIKVMSSRRQIFALKSVNKLIGMVAETMKIRPMLWWKSNLSKKQLTEITKCCGIIASKCN